MNNSNIKWVDILKGIGIFFVVVGHIFKGKIVDMIFLFHMPLFFFVSGYLFKPTDNLIGFFKKKVIHLLVPYLFFMILIYIPQEISCFMSGKDTFVEAVLRPILGGKFLVGWTGVFWFTTCLFFVQQVMNLLYVSFDKKNVSIIMCISMVFGYINGIIFPGFWLPWSINIAFVAMPIFYIGYLCKNINYFDIIKISNFLILLCISIGILIVPGNYMNMKNAYYGIPVITIISSFVIIVFLIILSKKISNFPLMSNVLSSLGSASIIVMYLHQPIQMILVDSFGITSYMTRLIFSLVLSFLFYKLFNHYDLSKALFLGNKEAFQRVLPFKHKL
ncbi:acyltransferase family protein [Fibrella forsythiae]|uniref:Acyltransferase family protein n=1 Tax=Fibrella forsythiae TaxID=2817061 RepID=A0ABS3JCP8_9BACT|nr:acyltransferase family protein [Fibrella forsythiae]MBO0947783.1 acyltransferase family protein [Fibrella forsythiae]